jgi:competence protein ComEA
LDSAVVNRLATASFIASTFHPRKLNINTVDERELAAHPYFRKAVARSIVTYRFQHGEFKSLDDLSNIHALDPETIRKIVPYLTLEK